MIADLNMGEEIYLEVRDKEVRLIFVAKDKEEAIAIAETVAQKIHLSGAGPIWGTAPGGSATYSVVLRTILRRIDAGISQAPGVRYSITNTYLRFDRPVVPGFSLPGQSQT